jgi:beta-phosphoglucomutase family hydrolase
MMDDLRSAHAFIFDMDGTLVDNMQWHAQAWATLLAESGITLDLNDFIVETAGMRNSEIAEKYLGKPGGLPNPSRHLRLFERKEALYRTLYAPHLRPVDGLAPFLTWASRLGIPMAVATAAPPDNIPYILDSLDLRHFFRVVVGAADVQRGKPHPDIFLKSAELLGIAPADCLVFEDSLNGLEAARRAGMAAIAVATAHTPAELAPHADRVITTFRDLL